MTTLCLAGDRCRLFDRVLRLPAPVSEDCPLCDAEIEAAQRDVRALVLDFGDLEQLLPPALGVWSDGTGGGTGGAAPIPLREGVDALQREIHWVLVTWAEVLADRDRLSDPGKLVRSGFAVQWAVKVIAPRARLLAMVGPVDVWSYPTEERPDGADLAEVSGAQGLLDLSRLHARALSMLGLTRPVWKLPGVCPDCREQDVLRREVQGPNADTVWCEGCRYRAPYGDYERYMRQLLWEGVP